MTRCSWKMPRDMSLSSTPETRMLNSPRVFIVAALLSIQLSASAAAQGEEFRATPRIESLLKEGSCWACHGVSEQRVGPPFQSVAQMYPDATAEQLAVLADKIRFGGAGKWGVVPMTPHLKMKQEDIMELLRWVLKQT